MWLNQRRGHAGREVEASAPERGHRCVLRRAGSFGIKHVKSRAAHRHLATPAVGSTNRLSDMPLFDKMRSSMMHRLLFLTVLAWVLVISPRAAHAGDTLNVQDWLSQPGVRLVAVEFYATWCKPCMEAMPRWKKLKEKYASQGLRVVVVNTQDPDGGCRSLPFVPDETVCDLDGYISDGFGLQGKLPSAFLWSWQGNLLVSKGHIDEVEHAVEAYLKDAPRVVIEAAADVPADAAAGVRERLTDDGKVLVLAGAVEQAALAAARRAQQSAQYDEKLTCKIGMEVPPNALLKVSRVAQGKSAFLNVGLYDLTGGCLLASASSELNGPGKQVAQDAASKLLRKLKRPDGLQQPASGVPRGSSSSKARADKVVNPEDRGWKPTSDEPSLVIFESTPKGARVEVDANVLCETPCKRMLPPGQPVIRMSIAKYVAKEERVKVDAEKRLSWTLERNTAQVTVETGVSGVPIVIDDEPSGESPVSVELAAGAHRIEIKDRCFEPARADVGIVRGVAKTVTLKGLAKTSGLRVELSAADGDPAEGDVMLDGKLVGRTWKTLQVVSCGTKVEVKSDEQMWSREVKLTPYETTRLEGELNGARKKTLANAPSKAVSTGDSSDGGYLDLKQKVDPPRSGEWMHSAGGWTLGIGLTSLATGITTALVAYSQGADIKSRHDACVQSGSAFSCPSQSAVDTATMWSTVGNVGIYSGAGLTALGWIWLASAPSTKAAAAVDVQVGPSGLSVRGRF